MPAGRHDAGAPDLQVHDDEIVVAYDASDEARRAVRWAADEAETTGRPLVVVTVVEPARYGLDPSKVSLRHFLVDEGRRIGGPALHRVRTDHPGLAVRLLVRVGSPRACLELDAADAAEMVLGVRARRLVGRLTIGSVAHHLLRCTTTPLVLVPEAPPDSEVLAGPGVGRVVAVVGPRAGCAAVDTAIDLGARRHRHVTLVRAVDPGRVADDVATGYGGAIEQGLARARHSHPSMAVEVRVHPGDVASALEHAVSASDLVVLGNHEPGEHRHLLADRALLAVLARPCCPVVVVPDHEHHATVGAHPANAPARPPVPAP